MRCNFVNTGDVKTRGIEVASFLNCQAVRNVGRSQGGVTCLSSQVQGHVFVGHLDADGLENTFQSVTQFTLMSEEAYGLRSKKFVTSQAGE
jgi:hypothetical protein